MGVPKFFRYISERYPCLSELAREQSIPEFDNLYLDMNGIVHNCSHPDDSNIHFHIEEDQIFKEVFKYVDKLFYLIKPQKLFFMAIDGVAPRAKMNQQRSRRFRSAKEAEAVESLAKLRGEKREHERFDSNCITPGTEFMVRLQEALRYFVKNKLSTDPLWKNCRIILSGHDTPGEGEHKIMDYIRYLKSQSDFDPNTRHCLYGLDADLIILGLCTHELHFVILREEVKFGRKKSTAVEQTRFFLLHLGLLREYLELEFNELRQHDPNFDVAKIIDDWVLMGFLVGNDFVPHLPCLHISSNALPLLYKTYIKVYPQLGGNINEHGKLNLPRLEKYFEALSDVEFEQFQEHYADLQYFNAKLSSNGIEEAFDVDVDEIKRETANSDLNDLIQSSRELFDLDDDDDDDEFDEAAFANKADKHLRDEFKNYKRNYYRNKLQREYNDEVQFELVGCYIEALQWILDYYYRGVQSWDWYYPHHYAPFISDLRNFHRLNIKFNMGKPFLPFQQLLAVLPAASRKLLPEAYHDLMTSPTSEVISFYPDNFEFDLNGKKHDWEAVVLIPFIDEKLLLSAMAKCESKLTIEEKNRNTHGPMFQYDYCETDQGQLPGIHSLKTIYHIYCTELPIWSKEIAVCAEKTICIELPNAARHVFFPGFPTMKHLKFDFELKNNRVKVFDFASRSVNMILQPHKRDTFCDVFAVAEKYLNQVVYIGWPHLIKSKVVQVFSKDKVIDLDGIHDNDSKAFKGEVKTVEEHLNTRMGIEVDDLSVLVGVRIYAGRSFEFGQQGRVIANDAWSTLVTIYPAQCLVSNLAVCDSVKKQFNKVEELFETNSTIFFIGNPYYGSEGTVLDPKLVYECGRLQVSIVVRPEPDFSEAKLMQSEYERNYVNLFDACNRTGLSPKCMGRITGSVLVVLGARRVKPPENVSKLNVGLQFKYPKQQEERSGYARRINNQWYYSLKALDLILQYYEMFPEVIHYLSTSNDRNEYIFEQDLYPESVGDKLVEKICAWLKEQEHMKCESVPSGSKTIEKETVEALLELTADLKNQPVKTVKLQVKPHLLLKPNVTLPEVYKSKSALRLFDRVVVVRTTYSVPVGAKGTVIGIYPTTDPNPVRLECVNSVENFYEILFDRRIPNCNDIYGIANERVNKLPESALILIMTNDKKSNVTNNMKVTQSAQYFNKGGERNGQTVQQPSTSSSNNVSSNLNKSIPRTPSTMVNNRKTAGSDFWLPSSSTQTPPKFVSSNSSNNSNNNTNNSSQNINNAAAGVNNINYKTIQNNNNKNNNNIVNTQKQQQQSVNVAAKQPVTILQKQQHNEQFKSQNLNAPSKAFMLPVGQLLNAPRSLGPLSLVPPNGQKFAAPNTIQPCSNQQQTLLLKNLLGLEQPLAGVSIGVGTPSNASASAATQTLPQTLPQPPIFWQRDAQTCMDSAVIAANVDMSTVLSKSMSTLKMMDMPNNPTATTVTTTTPASVCIVNSDVKPLRKKRVPKIGAKFDFA